MKIQKGTLGRLVGEVRTVVEMESEFENIINEFVEERNWLVHRLVDQNKDDLHDPVKTTKLIARIEKLGSEARRLNTTVTGFLLKYVEARGSSREDVLKHAAASLEGKI